MNLQELQNLVSEIQKSLAEFSRNVLKRLDRLDLLFSPVLRNPGHTHTYPMGEVSYFNTTGTAIAISGTSDGSTNMVVVNPTTTLSSDTHGFDSPSAGRLRYIGTKVRCFHIACSISFAAAGAADTFVFGIAKNGTVMSSCKILTRNINASDTRSTALHCYTEMNPNDYLELYVGNTTDADDVTIKTVNLFAMGMDCE